MGIMTSITDDGQVEFRFYRPNVRSVSLVGDFNGSDNDTLAMNSTGDGWWTALMRFAAGDYRFRYLADGKWFNDYASFGVEPTQTGFNSILRVPETEKVKRQNTCAKQVA
jgi:1,4-alpha-glucan branching enzyme